MVYGGFYNDLVINGDHLLEADFTVVNGGSAALSGNMTGTADLVFNGATSGDATFGTADTAYAGDVTFGEEAALVYEGHYTNLTITGDHDLENDITVAGHAAFTGVQSLADGTTVIFNGTTNAADGTGSLLQDISTSVFSTVIYNGTADIFGGSYGNLTISEGTRIANSDFAVAGDMNFDGTLTGTANVTIMDTVTTNGTGVFGTDEEVFGGSVTYYKGDNVTLYDGFYKELILEGSFSIADRTITVTDRAEFNGAQNLSGTTVLTLSGKNEGTDAAIASDVTATVIYNGVADQNVYTGTYGNLTIEGDHLLANDFTVNALATVNGVMNGNADVTFNGDTAGTGTFGASEADAYQGKVTYEAAASVIYGGNYADLVINGDHLLTADLTVVNGGTAALSGTMTGSADVTFNGTNTGDALFGTDTNRYAGIVTYNGNSVYGGFYGGTQIEAGLVLTDGTTIAAGINVDAASVALTGTLTVDGFINFSGYTDAMAKGDDAVLNAINGVVEYAATADIYGGTYGDLILNGNRHFYSSLTVNGTTTIRDNGDGSNAKLTADDDVVLTFVGAVTGNGAEFDIDPDYDGMKVIYQSADGEVLGGTYGDLTVAVARTLGNDFTVNGDAVLTGVQTVSKGVELTFNGTTNDTDAVELDAKDATIVYGKNVGVYNGVYGTLVLNGAHTLTDKTVTVLNGAEFNGTQTLKGDTKLTLTGTNSGDEARINAAETTSVIYNGAADQGVFAGTYGNLTIEGSHLLANKFTVNGAAVLSGTMTGSADVEFNGATSGDATFGTKNTDYAGVVSFGTGADEIYGGYYSELEISGNHILDNDITVSGSAYIRGSQTLAGEVELTFKGTTSGLGQLVDDTTDDKFSTVTYAATADVYGGSYGNLTITGDHYFAADVTVNGTTTIKDNADGSNASLTGAATADLIFNGAVIGNGALFGVAPAEEGQDSTPFAGSVTYNSAEGEVLGGFYSKLTLDGDRTISGKNISVADQLDVKSGTQTLSNTNLTLSGKNRGSGTFDGKSNSSVIYDGDVTQGIIGGTYGILEIVGDHTVNNSIKVNGTATLSGVQTINSGVTVEFAGRNNAVASTGSSGSGTSNETTTTASATIDGKNGSTVIYGASADVYGGSYGNLTIKGGHTLANEFSVSGTANITGIQSGEVKVTFNAGASIQGNGSFGTADENGAYKGDVIYNSSSDVYGGYYTNLTLNGNNTINNRNITITGIADVNGIQTLKGSTYITFAAKDNTGSGTFNGQSNSTVHYTEGTNVYGGTYWNLIIDGDNTVDRNLTVNNMLTLVDETVLSGSGNWIFNYSNADKDSKATIKNTGSVTYNASGWIYGGEYKDIVINGNYFTGDVLINGNASGSGVITFEGTVGGSGQFAGLNAVYNVGGNILKGVYGDLSVRETGVITGSTRVTGDLIALATSTAGDAISGASTSYALITGSGTLKVEGKLVNFDGSDTASKGRFDHTGNVILAGTSYNIVGGPSGNSFGTLTVEEGVSLNLGLSTVGTFDTGAGSTSRVAGVQFGTIKGAGDIFIYKDVTGSSITMEGGTVTYTAEAPTTLIYGTYYNLTLQQSEGLAVPSISIEGTVNVARHFNIGGHNLQVASNGNLTMLTFDGEAALENSGTVTFGSQSVEVGSPGTRQYWDGGVITNEGDIIVNRNNYTFASVLNEGDAKATFTVTKEAGFGDSTAVELEFFRNEFGATATLNGTTRIMEMANGGWTNEGTLSIDGFENFGFTAGTPLDITIANRAELNIANGGDYFFDNTTNVLHLGGAINAETGTTILFMGVDEVVGTKSYSTTGEGTMIFAFTSPITEGLYGNLNNQGTMIFATEGQKYLGSVTNGSAGGNTDGYLYILADSVFKGAVTSEYGLVSVGYMPDGTDEVYYPGVDVTFVHTVHSGSAFLIAAGSNATFENTVTVAHEFTLEGPTDVVDTTGATITLNGATALFKGDVEVYADSGNDADTIFHVQEGAAATFLGDLTNRNEGTAWHSVLMIDGSVTVNGTLTNTASSSLVNVANVIVNSDNNTFGAITNTGAGAKFELNSDNNQFNGTTTNSGQLYLNGVNRFNTIKNTTPGYLWINEGASGSTFVGDMTNTGTVTIVSDDPGIIEIDLVFDGGITNSGIFNVNTQGSTFNGGITNSGTVNLFAAAVFDSLVTNSGTFNVSADGAFFSEVTNSGTFAVKVQDVTFHGRFTNSGTLDLNGTLKTPGTGVENRDEYFFFYEMTNSGTVNLHTAYQTVIKNLVQEGGTIFIDKDSTLHLSMVNDDAASKIQVDGDRQGIYDAHLTVDRSDTLHGLYFENVPGLEEPQKINASIIYKGDIIEDAVWFNEDYTYLVGEEATWIVVNTEMVLNDFNEKGKYRVVEGGKLIVNGTASGSRFQVKDNGELIFNNTRDMTVNGMLQVKDADASVTFQGEGELEFNRTVYNSGHATFQSEDVSFNAGFVNKGVVTAYTDVNGTITNEGTYTLAGEDLTIGGEGTQLVNNGELEVTGSGRLESVIGGTISVADGATLTAGVTEIAADLRNDGTVKIDNEHNYLAVTGDVLKADGTFTSDEPATLVVSGSVEKGTSGTFDNIANVVYNGTAAEVPGENGEILGTYAEGQNIILGAYDNLTLEGSFKVVDNGAVTVDGTFTNTNEVKVAGDAALTLNGAVAGDGIYTNEGLLSFSETAAGTAATINNSGRTDINGAVDVDTLDNSGTVNVNADGIVINGSNDGETVNDGVINVNGDNTVLNVINREDGTISVTGDDAALGGWNLGDVTVSGSAATTMQDAAGATYTVAKDGELSLGNNGGTYNAAITNNGTVSVDAPVSSFAGGITNNGTIEVNESDKLDLNGLLAGNANGQIALNDKISLQDQTIVGGVQVNYGLTGDDLSGTKVAENAVFTINADGTVNQGIEENKGIVKIADGVTFTVDAADAAFDGVYDIDGTFVTTGNAEFTGSVDNTGDLMVGGDAEFSGSVNNTGDLMVGGDAEFSGSVNNTGNIAADNAQFSGPVANNGTISVDNIVIFSGETSGTGRVESDIAIYDGNATGIFAGDYGTLIIYTDATMLGNASTDQLYLYGSLQTHENGTLTVNGELFQGEILYPTGNGSWAAFSPAGGVGTMYPHITNPNFHAIAPYLNELYLEWGDSSRFDRFRRLPAEQRPIAVGDMMEHVMLNTYDKYDMIDFDSEFFGNSDAIGILDDESREVLEDALTVEASDLKALLED